MIQKIEFWLNIVHYCIYKVDYRFQLLFNKINPVVLIGSKLPVVKRRFEKQSTTFKDAVNNEWSKPDSGFGIMISGGLLIIVITVFLWGLVSTLLGVTQVYFHVKHIYMIAYFVLAYLICHLLVFRKDKYLQYFKKLDAQPKNQKIKQLIFSTLFGIISIALWIFSFRFTPI